MFQPIHRNTEYGLRQGPYNRMDAFMFGNNGVPAQQSGLTKQRFNPLNLLNSPQISKGINGFSGILDNVQQVLRIVETTTPLVKEYGPMIKNLPAMYRMMKAFKEIDSESDENTEQPTATEAKKEESQIGNQEMNKDDKMRGERRGEGEGEEREKSNNLNRSGLSTPKLYI